MLVIAFAVISTIVSLDSLRRLLLVGLYYLTRRATPRPTSHFQDLPRVTIQLPIYMAKAVVSRLLEAVCNLDYPRHLLQIQLLDDSTDDTTRITRELVERYTAAGINITLLHRNERRGYKSGALHEAFPTVTGEFLAVFDADFVPSSSWLRELIHYFTDPAIGMVQSRWEHLNRNTSLVTAVQALNLDAHFLIENQTRNRTGRFFSNNGTAGIWRRKTIEDSGGWGWHLAEDAHLSLRAQLKGWRFVLVNAVSAPAELPATVHDFVAQQERWARALLLTGYDLLGTLLKSDQPLKVKVEELFHLLAEVTVLPFLATVFILIPLCLVTDAFREHAFVRGWIVSLFVMAYASHVTYYVIAQRELGRPWRAAVFRGSLFIVVRMGMAVHIARGVLAIMFRDTAFRVFGYDVEGFEGSPKYDLVDGETTRASTAVLAREMNREARVDWLARVDVAAAFYLVCFVLLGFWWDKYVEITPLGMAMCGFAWVGFGQIWTPTKTEYLKAKARALWATAR